MAWWKRGAEQDPTAARQSSAERPAPARGTPRAAAEPAGASPAFDLVRRGYDRAEVDARVGDVQRALAGNRSSIDTALLRATGAATGLTIVRRGYDRAQVEAWCAAAADGLDAR